MNIKKMIKELLKKGRCSSGKPYTERTLATEIGVSQAHLNRMKSGGAKNPGYQLVMDLKALHDEVCIK